MGRDMQEKVLFRTRREVFVRRLLTFALLAVLAFGAAARADELQSEDTQSAESIQAEPTGAESIRAEAVQAEPTRAEPVQVDTPSSNPTPVNPVPVNPVPVNPAPANPKKAPSPAHLRYQKFLQSCDALAKAPETPAAYTLRQILQASKKKTCRDFRPGKRGFVFLGNLNLHGREIEDVTPFALFRFRGARIDLSRNRIQNYSPLLKTIRIPRDIEGDSSPSHSRVVDLSENQISQLSPDKSLDQCSLILKKNRLQDPWALLRQNMRFSRLCSLSLEGNVSGRGEAYDRALEAINDFVRAFQSQDFRILESRLSPNIQKFGDFQVQANRGDGKKQVLANLRRFYKTRDILEFEVEENSMKEEPQGELLRVTFRSTLRWQQQNALEEVPGADFLLNHEFFLDAEGKITRYESSVVPRALIGMKTERAYKTLSPLKEYLEDPYGPLPPTALRIPAGEKVVDLNEIVEGTTGNRGGLTVRLRKVLFRGKSAWIRERTVAWQFPVAWGVCEVDPENGKLVNFDEEDEGETEDYRNCQESPVSQEQGSVQEEEERFFIWAGDSK